MTNYQSGHDAEKSAAKYLESQGYKIIELNWRTKLCEIDIVCKKNDIVHFVEVKSRSSAKWGSGLDYITPKKLKQMEFAANMWVQNNNWGGDYRLDALAVDSSAINLVELG